MIFNAPERTLQHHFQCDSITFLQAACTGVGFTLKVNPYHRGLRGGEGGPPPMLGGREGPVKSGANQILPWAAPVRACLIQIHLEVPRAAHGSLRPHRGTWPALNRLRPCRRGDVLSLDTPTGEAATRPPGVSACKSPGGAFVWGETIFAVAKVQFPAHVDHTHLAFAFCVKK